MRITTLGEGKSLELISGACARGVGGARDGRACNSTPLDHAVLCCAVQAQCTFGPKLSDEEVQELVQYVQDQAAAGWKQQ